MTEFDGIEQTARVTFSPGDSDEKAVELTVHNDDRLEGNETFLIDLRLPRSSAWAGGQLGTRSSAVGIIVDDDSELSID